MENETLYIKLQAFMTKLEPSYMQDDTVDYNDVVLQLQADYQEFKDFLYSDRGVTTHPILLQYVETIQKVMECFPARDDCFELIQGLEYSRFNKGMNYYSDLLSNLKKVVFNINRHVECINQQVVIDCLRHLK